MAEISIGAAVGEGFSLIRRRPLAVLAWGLAPVGLTVLTYALLWPLMASSLGEAFRQAQLGAPSPTPSPAAMQTMMQAQSLNYLFNIISLVVNAVVSCAVFRAVIHPEQSRFAYLRVGAPELLLALLLLGAGLAAAVAIVIAAIPIAIVVFILTSVHAGAVAVIVGVAAGLAAIAVLIYFGLRLSLVAPMMVDEGQLRLTEGWALTRGKAASLLAIGLLVALILFAGEIVIGLIMVGLGMGALSAMAGGLQNVPTLMQNPARLVGALAPLLALVAVVFIPLVGCAMAVMGAPWARAYLDLRPRRDIAETFV